MNTQIISALKSRRDTVATMLFALLFPFNGCGNDSTKAVALTDINLSRMKLELFEGDEMKVVATPVPDNAPAAFVWASANKAVATVNDAGSVKAVAEGSTDITVSATDGQVTKSIPVTVSKRAVTSIALDAPELPLLAVGEKLPVKATTVPVGVSATFGWTSSDETVFRVSSSGELTATGEGFATLTVTANPGNATKKVLVTVFPEVENRQIVMNENVEDRILIVDQITKQTVWEWSGATAAAIPVDAKSWFTTHDEVKPIYGRRYILTVSSGGCVAIIRIADKKVMFYAHPAGNPHSAEVLPDGNVVVASSTGGTLKLYKVDTVACFAAAPLKTYTMIDAHNVVWDKASQLLWATATPEGNSPAFLYAYTYNGNELTEVRKYQLPAGQTWPHDVFPKYGTNTLLISTSQSVLQFDTESRTFSSAYSLADIKAVSTGPTGYPVISVQPITEWWTDKVISTSKSVLYESRGFEIYKARWMVDNPFSYESGVKFRQP